MARPIDPDAFGDNRIVDDYTVRNVGMEPPMEAGRPRSNHEEIEHNLTNHPPISDWQIDRMEQVRRAAKLLAHTIEDCCPPSREKSLAQTNSEQACMWAIASLARM